MEDSSFVDVLKAAGTLPVHRLSTTDDAQNMSEKMIPLYKCIIERERKPFYQEPAGCGREMIVPIIMQLSCPPSGGAAVQC